MFNDFEGLIQQLNFWKISIKYQINANSNLHFGVHSTVIVWSAYTIN